MKHYEGSGLCVCIMSLWRMIIKKGQGRFKFIFYIDHKINSDAYV